MSGGPRRSTNWPTTGSHANSQSRQFNTDTNFLGQSEHDETDIFLDNSQEHAVVSTFDLFSVGIGPSSSHTVGPMRAGNIFVNDIIAAGLFQRVHKIFVTIYGSLALTGEGHMTPSALLLGLESANVETVDTAYVPARFEQIKVEKKLHLGHGLPGGKGKEITFDYSKDFRWEWGKKLPLHSNGMRLMVFDKDGTLLATNDYFSIGGGFVVNGKLSTATNAVDARTSWSPTAGNEKATQVDNEAAVLTENVFYKEIQGSNVVGDRKKGVKIQNYDEDVNTPTEMVQAADGGEGNLKSNSGPHYPFRDARSLLSLCRKHNLTIAQLVYENEKSQGYTDEQIYDNLMRLWEVMDTSISDGVQAPINGILPGALKVHRRAPALYRTLRRGLHSSQIEATAVAGRMQEQSSSSSNVNGAENQEAQDVNERAIPGSTYSSPDPDVSTHKRPSPTNVLGMLNHQIMPSLQRYTGFLAMEYLTVYAMAVNETNAGGGRVVTAPTNGAAGIIPAVLKYTLEFISEDKERDICNFLLTAAAIGMLYKRGATISAAEGGCMAEVGVACSMAAGAFAACMGASPETIEQAAEIGIEHNLGLTCDPIGGLVQAPCIERNALGAIKAISSANLALNSHPGTQKVTLDDAIRAMRLTAQGMRTEFKETSLSGLATSVSFDIPVSVPDC